MFTSIADNSRNNSSTAAYHSFNIQDLYDDLNRLEISPRKSESESAPRIAKVAKKAFYQTSDQGFYVQNSRGLENLADILNTASPITSPREESPESAPKVAKKAFYRTSDRGLENLADILNSESPLTSPREESFVFTGAAPSGYTGYATLNCNDGGVYVGDFEDGIRSGIGTLTYPDRVYTAYWENDKLHGLVELTFTTGGFYIGHWENGKRQNRGMLIYHDGTYYAGEWKKGMRHGHGIRTGQNGSFYKGMWKDDMRHGHGFQMREDGTVFTGDWVNNKPQAEERKFTQPIPEGMPQ